MAVIIVSKANKNLLLAPYGFENEQLAMDYVINIGKLYPDEVRIIPLPIMQAPLTMFNGEITAEPIYKVGKIRIQNEVIRDPGDLEII